MRAFVSAPVRRGEWRRPHTDRVRLVARATQLKVLDRRLRDAALEVQDVAAGVFVPLWALVRESNQARTLAALHCGENLAVRGVVTFGPPFARDVSGGHGRDGDVHAPWSHLVVPCERRRWMKVGDAGLDAP